MTIIKVEDIRAAGGFEAWKRREECKAIIVSPAEGKAPKTLSMLKQAEITAIHPYVSALFSDSRITEATRVSVPNGVELAHWQRLHFELYSGEVEWIGFERVTFELAHECTYTPDFPHVRCGGLVVMDEIKGPHMWEDSWIKLKIASRLSRGGRGKVPWRARVRPTARKRRRGAGLRLGKLAHQRRQAVKANEVKNAILAYYRFKRQFPYLATECLDSDVLVSDGQLLTEVEVKVAFSDYRREFKKGKYTEWHRGVVEENRGQPYACNLDPNFMFFAAPEELAHKIIADPEHHKFGHGVLSVKKGLHTYYTRETGQYTKEVVEVEVLRRAKKLHSNSISDKSLHSIVSRMASELITMRQQVRA